MLNTWFVELWVIFRRSAIIKPGKMTDAGFFKVNWYKLKEYVKLFNAKMQVKLMF